MKSILNSKFSALSPYLCRTKTTPFESIICNNPIRIHNQLHLKSTPLSNNFICSIQNRSLHMEASQPPACEIHVMVGRMFAGKTTALLRQIQMESSSGRSNLKKGIPTWVIVRSNWAVVLYRIAAAGKDIFSSFSGMHIQEGV